MARYPPGILIGESGHRAFEWLDHARGLQRVVVGLILNSAAEAIANGHNNQAEQGGQDQ